MRTFLLLLLGLGLLAGRVAGLTLEQLAADPRLWPAEVTVTAMTRASLVEGGRAAGMMLIGAGKKLVVTGVAVAGVTGKMGAVTVLVPADKTDLFWQVGKAHPEHATEKQREVARVSAPLDAALQNLAGGPAPAPAAPAASRATTPPAWAGRASVMQRRLAGRVVRLEGGTLQPFDAAQLAGVKYYGLYYSAGWCGPCRQFTPEFIRVYRLMKQQYPEFEVVFVSADHSAGDMKSYMRDDGMPWLALKYDDAQSGGELQRYCGPGIPCLVLVDPEGRVLSDSFEGDNYVGPGKVLQDAMRLLAQNH